MLTIRPRRSALYMPGSNARAIEKAKTLPADVVIFDFEDAVEDALGDSGPRSVGSASADRLLASSED